MARARGGTVLLACVCLAGMAAAAGTTSVAVVPETASVTVGETTTVEVVVESADGGVGSLDVEVTAGNGSVVNVTGVTVAGTPEMTDVRGNGTRKRILANGMDTADSGRVTVVTVTMEAMASGRSTLDLTVTALGDESGSSYGVSDASSGTVRVVSESTMDGGGDGNGGTIDDATVTPTPGPEPTPTPTSVPETSTQTVGVDGADGGPATPTAGEQSPTSSDGTDQQPADGTVAPGSERSGFGVSPLVLVGVAVAVVLVAAVVYLRLGG